MHTHALTRTNQRLFVVGLSLLVIANATLFLVQRSHAANRTGGDALTGLLFGAAIGVLLLALVRRHRAT